MVRKAQSKTSRAFPKINATTAKRTRKDTLPSAKKRLKPDIPKDVTEGGDVVLIDKEQHSLDDAQEKLRKPGQLRTPTPEPPASVQATHTLTRPDADDPLLRDVYDIHTIAVVPNSKIQDKVRRVLSLLAPDKTQEGQDHDTADTAKIKPIIVALVSPESGTNKCISVAEIAKRELQSDGGQWRQYTGSWSRLETLGSEKERRNRIGGKVPNHHIGSTNSLDEREKRSEESVNENGSSEDEEGFEQMAVPDRKLVRNVPCLVIYLSRQAVPRLKELYGWVPFTQVES
jgi:hypothetical protein